MTGEPEDTRDAEPEVLGDGDIYIEDMPEFLERFGAIAVQNRNGALFVLKVDPVEWVNIELPTPRKPRAVK